MKKIRQLGGKVFLVTAVFLMCSACQHSAASGINEQSTAEEGIAVSRPPSLILFASIEIMEIQHRIKISDMMFGI